MSCIKNRLFRVLLLSVVLLSLSGFAHADCPTDNTVIAANTTYSSQVCAVDDVANNGVLQIGANSITLDCAGTVFVGSMRGIAITNPGYDGVTIKNCMIQDYNVGIWLNSAANTNKIMDNNITHNNFGIHILASTDANIWDNNVDKNNMRGIYIARDANRMWISDNNLSDNNMTGLETLASGDMNIRRNKISYNRSSSAQYALYLDGGDFNVSDNNFVGNIGRAVLLDDFRNKFTDNNVSLTTGIGLVVNTDTNILRSSFISNATGISITASARRIIINNSIFRSNISQGIFSNGATDVNVSNNTMDVDNATGISGHANDATWRMHDNNISSNSTGIILQGADMNVQRNEISYNTTGVSVQNGSNSVLDNNIIGNMYGFDVVVSGPNTVDVNISNNVIRASTGYGMYNSGSGGSSTLVVRIVGNDINSSVGYGVSFSYPTYALEIRKNNIHHNGSGAGGGVYLDGVNLGASSADWNLSDNNFTGNYPYGASIINATLNLAFADNNVQSNGYGFYVASSTPVKITNNRFKRNMYAAYLASPSTDVNFFSNTIDSNNGYGLFLNGVIDLNIADSNISDSNTTGFWSWTGIDVNFWRTTLKNNAVWDMNLNDTNIHFIDGNYGTLRFQDINAKVSRHWTIDLNIARSDTYAAVADANLWDINTQYGAALIGRTVAGSNGNFAQFTIKQFDQNFSSTAAYQYTPHTFRVTHDAYDSNTYTKTIDSNYDITIYLSPRGVSITSPKQGEVLSNPNVTFSYSASAGFSPVSKYWVKLDSQPRYTDNGTSATYSATLTSGSHTFYVIANGPQDVNSPAASVSFTINLGAGSAQCGDGVCGSGETAISCAADCPPVCGDGACTGTETPDTCPADCAVGCGDRVCDDAAGETCSSCPGDCGVCLPGELPPEIPGEGEIQQPISPFPGEMGKPACAGIQCDDDNPCTTDICFEGECSFIPKQDGTTCGFGMECFGGACVPVFVRAAGLPRIPIATEIVSMLISLLRLLGGEALEKAPLALALLIALAVIAAMLSYNRLRIFMPAETLSTRHVQMLTAARAGVAIAFFVVPFVVNRLVEVNAGITAAIIGIAIILLAHYLKKRSMERRAIRV